MSEQLTKLEAARRQIDASIVMFLREEDILAVHTVACAALGIVGDLANRQQKDNAVDSLFSVIKEDKREAFRVLWRQPQNFLKHAHNDPDEILEFRADATEFHIVCACLTYFSLASDMTTKMGGFMCWFNIKHPSVVFIPELRAAAEKYAKRFGAADTTENKRSVLGAIEQMEMNNPLSNT